jgi:hypothetical protein
MPRRIPQKKKPAGGKRGRGKAPHRLSPGDIAKFRQLLRLALAKNGGKPPKTAAVDPKMARFIRQAVHNNIAGIRLNAEEAARLIVGKYGDHPHVGFALQTLPASMSGRVMFYIEQITKGKKND